MTLLFLYTILYTVLNMCPLVTASENEQHGKCLCDVSTSEMTAECRLKNLTSVPDCIPNNTRHLFLQLNHIAYSPGQFQRFIYLKELSLYLNSEFTARNDSFRGLYHLQILNLGKTNCNDLTDDTFADLHNLRELELSTVFGQLNLNQALFTPLKNITTLDLSNNFRLEIQNYLFYELSKLEKLTANTLLHLQLNTYSFEGLTALKSLSLADPVASTVLPEDIFKPLIRLEEIRLQGICSAIFPAFDCMTIDKQLKYAPSLKRIYIDNVLISHLGTGFKSLENLEEIHFIQGTIYQNCEVRFLNDSYFRNLEAVPLTKLFLDHCFMVQILANTFSLLTNLSTLNVNIESIASDFILSTFAIGLANTNIENIRLSLSTRDSHCHLDELKGLRATKLKSFELSLTSPLSISGDSIKQLPKTLRQLILSNNRLEYFDVENLGYLENLETLDLSNAESEVQPSCWKKGKGVELNRTETGQLKFQKGHNETLRDCLTIPYKLKYLNVHNSSLLCVMTYLFSGSNNSLRTLIASEQRDRFCIKSNEFWTNLKTLVKLEELNLDWNLISEIPRDAFSGQSILKTLSLKGNKLIELSFHVDAMVHLHTLDLSSNSIRYASTSFTKDTKDVSVTPKLSMDLFDNPLVCDCKHQDFVTWLRDTNVILEKNNLNCTAENGTKISLSQIAEIHDLLEVECILLEITVGCVALFSILNLLLGSIAYIWHIRQKLRYLLSYGRRTLNPYHPIEDCDIEMEYDVYISYEGDSYLTPNETLRDFVLYKLLPGLERRGFKVGIREEFDPGRNLYEMISSTVRRSKKVFVLLTKDYCKDMWNVFEFNQAVMEGIYTNRQIAIPILFESLGRDSVKEEVFAFLRMEPVARYSQDVSDRVFINYVCEKIRDTTRKFN